MSKVNTDRLLDKFVLYESAFSTDRTIEKSEAIGNRIFYS